MTTNTIMLKIRLITNKGNYMDEERKKFLASIRVEKENHPTIKKSKGIIYPNYLVKNGIDGLTHIDHVTHLGIKIGEQTYTDEEILHIALGCLLHDVGRGRELPGQRHGAAGEPLVRSILKDRFFQYFDIDVDKIAYAVKHHDEGKVIRDRIIGGIWDADRLSLFRFPSKVIDLSLLSTNEAKELLSYAKKYIEDNMGEYNRDRESDDDDAR